MRISSRTVINDYRSILDGEIEIGIIAPVGDIIHIKAFSLVNLKAGIISLEEALFIIMICSSAILRKSICLLEGYINAGASELLLSFDGKGTLAGSTDVNFG